MERQGIIKYFEQCFETLNQWIKESPAISKTIYIYVTFGMGKSEPMIKKQFEFASFYNSKFVTAKYLKNEEDSDYKSCCIIVDDAFVNIWLKPEWKPEKGFQNSYYWPEKRLYFVDGSNESVQDRYTDELSIEFPTESYYPIGVPDLFIAHKSIVEIEIDLHDNS